MNGDMVLSSADIRGVMETGPACMGVAPSGHPEDYGVVQVEGDRVRGLREKARERPATS